MAACRLLWRGSGSWHLHRRQVGDPGGEGGRCHGAVSDQGCSGSMPNACAAAMSYFSKQQKRSAAPAMTAALCAASWMLS